MKTLMLRLAFFCLMITLLASCKSQSPNSTATIPAVEITSFPATMSLNNIDVEVSGYELHKFDLSITICFESPREGDWLFGEINLNIEDQEFPNAGVGRDPTPGRADGFECQTIQYYVTDRIIPTGKAELTIGRLEHFVPMEDRNCPTAQKHLNEAESGIVVTCDPIVPGAFTVTKKPMLMSSAEAVLIAMDAFSYSESIPLNWKFSFLLEKP